MQVASAWLDDGFLPRRVVDDFWTPVRLNDGRVNEQNYAIGWRVDRSITKVSKRESYPCHQSQTPVARCTPTNRVTRNHVQGSLASH